MLPLTNLLFQIKLNKLSTMSGNMKLDASKIIIAVFPLAGVATLRFKSRSLVV